MANLVKLSVAWTAPKKLLRTHMPTPMPPTNRAAVSIAKFTAPVWRADPTRNMQDARKIDHFREILSAIQPWFMAPVACVKEGGIGSDHEKRNVPMKAPSSIMAVIRPFMKLERVETGLISGNRSRNCGMTKVIEITPWLFCHGLAFKVARPIPLFENSDDLLITKQSTA